MTTGRFCEVCGHDVIEVSHRPSWSVEIRADHHHYRRMAPATIDFPDAYPARSVPLEEPEIRIGRGPDARGNRPTIDLSSEPQDPGISHLHAMLVMVADRSYALVDLGSTNGTTVNDGTTRLEVGEPRPLADGDRIHIGAWTTITIHAS